MGNSTKPRSPVGNQMLAALPKKEYQRLLPDLEPVTLAFADVLYEPDQPIRHVYFPISGMVSLLSNVNERATTAVNIVGKDGMIGIQVFLEMNISPNRAVVHVAGTALRMEAEVLQRESQKWPLERLLRRYTQALLTQAHQATICNHFHNVNERLASWLLFTHDQAGVDEFPMTHQFMSGMMGVRREEISKAAAAFQKNKLISYTPGRIRILNRTGLKAICCKCYSIIRAKSVTY
ncbi:MAG TPA: Crp/Fnr family transcriptional regulator [Pyrinomonadaceae bacterium]|nr:Crp/Fnr family transcriptional regulator [Pyrinomonadaceae bacterium]